MKNYIMCCDWGTSFFRLRLINIINYQLIGEVVSSDGIASTFDIWKSKKKANGAARDLFFRQQIKKQIDLLSAKLSIDLNNTAILISGMASSSIGMKEVPYATLPFILDGSQASVKRFEPQHEFPHEMILISGLRSNKDVMRGEETQLIGMLELMALSGNNINNAIFIFPGTHSKHIYIENGQIINFETCMTGEVFNLMANQSILKDSVDVTAPSEFSSSDLHAFKLGLQASSSSNILYTLFTVRTNQLFDKLDKKQNSLYLSGLLIGTELNHLLQNENAQLVLCSGSNLFEFYKIAMEELSLLNRTTIIPAELIDKAAFVGQIRIFRNQKMQLNGIAE